MLTVGRVTSATCVLALATLPISSGALAQHRHRARHRQRTRTTVSAARQHRRDDLVLRGRRHRHRVHAAGDPGDTISDFQFSPGTLTIHVGDTVTWTNNGPSPHTATASGGSFDTGTLQRGQSASHTFGQAGTFAYICRIHPFMHGTVVVVGGSSGSSPGGSSGSSSGSAGSSSGTAASGSSGTSAGSSSGSAGSSSGSTAAGGSSSGAPSNGGTLPLTGYNVLITLSLGGLLFALGHGIRRIAGQNADSA